MTGERVRVGLVGTGVIAQVMHLHYLAELADRFDVAAVCDLDTLVHELNAVRGLLGEPTRVEYASLALDQVTVMLRFGDLPAAIHWIDLPGIARYAMEFALYAPDRRLRLTFPSPFLRNSPALLEIEAGSMGRSWCTEEIAGYESGFKNELVAFHEAVVTGRAPDTTGTDGLRDIMLCRAIIDSHHRGAPVDVPAGAVGTRGAGGMESPRKGVRDERSDRGGERTGQLRGVRADRRL